MIVRSVTRRTGRTTNQIHFVGGATMKRLFKFQLIALGIALFIGLCFDGWRIHPDTMTKEERHRAGYFEVGVIYIDLDDLK